MSSSHIRQGGRLDVSQFDALGPEDGVAILGEGGIRFGVIDVGTGTACESEGTEEFVPWTKVSAAAAFLSLVREIKIL